MGISKEKAFPRGGLPTKKAIGVQSSEGAKVRKFTKKDRDLFSTQPIVENDKKAKKNKKNKKKKSDDPDDDNVLNVKSVDPLTYDRLIDGLKVLGRISEIRDLEVKLSLPGRLVATVPITKMSTPYTEALRKVAENPELAEELGLRPLNAIFQVGQLVTCAIVDVDKAENDFYKVTATLDPLTVNEDLIVRKNAIVMAAVKSVEDHGFVMDIGKANLKAFLPVKKADKIQPTLGQVLPCVVTKVDGSAVVLSCEPSKIRHNVVRDLAKVSVHTMCPGMTFDTVVEDNLKCGLKLKFGDFHGYVNIAHQGQDDVEVGQDVKATVVYVMPMINHIYMSIQEQDLSYLGGLLLKKEHETKIGALVKDATVLEADQRGLVISLAEDEMGIVPLKHLSEVQRKELKTKFGLNTKVTVRVLQFDQFERKFVCSMQKVLLEQNVIKSDQLKVGELVTCKAKKFVAKGLLVEVGRNLDGFIPMLHLSDVPLKHPEKKFSIGSKMRCKVLKNDPSKKRLHLTAKKLLLDGDYHIVDDYDSKHVGQITEGMVVQVTKDGVLLQLFGEASGWVPKSKISVEPVEYPEKLFFLGQVLKCKVLDVQPEHSRMTLTLILGDHVKIKPLGSKEKKLGESVKLGKFYENIKVCDVTNEGLAVEVEDNVKAMIPKHHLTDHVSLADQLLSSYSVNDIISKALCYEKDVLPILTLKPSLLNFEGCDKMSFDDLHPGLTLPAVVATVKPYGVFVKLPTWKFRKNALIPLRHLSDIFVEDPNDYVQVHQTLYGQILETKEENQQITMTAKVKLLRDNTTQHSVALTSSLFSDLHRIKEHLKAEKGLLLDNVAIGDVVNCVVQEVTDFGLDTLIDGEIRGLVPNASLEGLDRPDKGQTVAGVIIFVDYQHGVVELTLQPEIVRKVALKAKSKKLPKEGQMVKAVCVLKRSEQHFATMIIKTPHQLQGQVIHVPTRHHVNDMLGFSDLYGLYEQYNIIVKVIDHDLGLIGVLEKHDKGKADKRPRLSSTSEDLKANKQRPRVASISEDLKAKRPRIDSETEPLKEVVEVEMNVDADPGWDKDFNPWGTGPLVKPSEGQEDVVEDEPSKKKVKTHLSKKEKKELDKLEEIAITKAEQRVEEGDDVVPESVDEFDRLVLASPDSSLCWIQYIAFHMEKQEFGLAREVIKRALEKINFREESERFNVYMAWFNMENSVGTEEQADKVLKEAIQCNDEYKVYEKIASIYMQNDKTEKAEKMYKIMARKFNKELEVWTSLGLFYFKTSNLKEARFTLQRSLQNLKKVTEIVAVTSKFAQFEFNHGEAERGKTIFEKIVRDFPSRIDQWSVYADMVIKRGEIEAARDIFERMISLGLAPKKMKGLFKKYWEFEQSKGDEQRVDAVRKKALEYLESQNIKVGEEDDPMDQMEIC